MQAYIVRLRAGCAHGKPNSIVGIFVTKSIPALRRLTDQAVDPALCEYTIIGEGGFIWPEEATVIPVPEGDDHCGDDDSYERLFVGCVPDEMWHRIFLFDDPVTWKPLVEKGMYLPGRGVVDKDDPIAVSVSKMFGLTAV